MIDPIAYNMEQYPQLVALLDGAEAPVGSLCEITNAIRRVSMSGTCWDYVTLGPRLYAAVGIIGHRIIVALRPDRDFGVEFAIGARRFDHVSLLADWADRVVADGTGVDL